jgi:divalent metal cation (Fe/Co/Zn/Cd) transporter
MTVSEAHDISHRVMNNLKRKIEGVGEVLVHIDPLKEQK